MLPAGAIAGWGLHPLESAAFARRTPETDIGDEADDYAEIARTFYHAIHTGTSYQDVMRLRRADGEFRWCHVRGEPLRDRRGRIEHGIFARVVPKFLALQHAKKLHGHELARLFKILPGPAKQEIERQIAALSGTSEWAGDIRTLSDIANVIEKLNSAFVYWRYSYERPDSL